jgi:hypothetical protein
MHAKHGSQFAKKQARQKKIQEAKSQQARRECFALVPAIFAAQGLKFWSNLSKLVGIV